MRNSSLLSIFIVALTLFLQQSVYAADFTVNTTTDLHDANTADGVCLTSAGDCSLRAAVEQAGINAQADRIFFNLPANSTIILTPANGGEILIADNLEIIGTGANNLTIDGGTGNNRIFRIFPGTVAISGVKLTGCETEGISGGAILAEGTNITLNAVEVTRNSISTPPGGEGTARTGGGLSLNGTARILNSTISYNESKSFACGGLLSQGNLYMANTTVSHNIANPTLPNVSGGGLCVVSGDAIIRNSTITNNTAGGGGGIFCLNIVSPQRLYFGNTIVAGNTATFNFPEIRVESAGCVVSDGHNLFGNSAGDSTSTQNAINYQATDIRDTNPLFRQLTYNGGTTQTHVIEATSPAIDAGDNAKAVNPFDNTPLLTDQRGRQRIIDRNFDGTARVDIGAFELTASASISGRVTDANGQGIPNARIVLTPSPLNPPGQPQIVASTNGLGYYRAEGVATGIFYSIFASKKGYQIPTRTIFVSDDLTEINLTAQP